MKVNTEIQRATKDLATRAKVVDVAHRHLGLHVSRRGSGPPQILCPFHDDHTPSLSLYDDHYHCFACNAHGNVFELVKAVLKIQFVDARKWLADKYGVQLPQPAYADKLPQNPRIAGLSLALEKYRHQNAADSKCLSSFALIRGFDKTFLNSAEVFGSKANKLSHQFKSTENYEELDALAEAGLVYQPKTHLPLSHPYQDFYYTDRIIFTLRTVQGEVAGFAGRAVGDDKPKYLFSRGLPKGDLLYRLDAVREKLLSIPKSKNTEPIHLYVVEGLLDALRCESLGLAAVAILGSRVTEHQTELLANLAHDFDRLNRQLVVHLFLDSDEAGRKGTIASIPSLWTATRNSLFVLDIILPKPEEGNTAHDPDEYLRNCSSIGDATAFLEDSVVSCLSYLMAHQFNCQPSDIDAVWDSVSQTERLACMRSIDHLGDGTFWSFAFAKLSPSSVFLGTARREEPEWLREIEDFLRFEEPRARVAPMRKVTDIEKSTPSLSRERISHAQKLAASSLQRRDIPVDEGAWLRMNLASDVFEEHFKTMLNSGKSHEEPFAAFKIPKRLGEFRLKALPCHEDLVLQQYMMNALLCDYPQNPRFLEWIPAIRFNRYERQVRSRLTGLVKPKKNEEIVSFAYQIDMDVLEGRTPPGDSGMFRHYRESWQEFIRYLDMQVARIGVRDLHVARLDIRQYYDQLPMFAVRDALLEPIEKAFGLLGDALQCAPEFRPDITDPKERAHKMVDWLCDLSFGYRYYDPSNGQPHDYKWKDRGVPQGPDLSAYLANIALFPLDKAVKDRIDNLNKPSVDGQEDNTIRAAYARYVDDLILITDSAEVLTQLQSLIENELSKLGLELNKKTAPLPSMTQADVREWLTDERGGLGVSTPSQAPTADFETLVNDCIDSGQVDRQDSLLVLHSPHMDDPITDCKEVKDGVRAARNSQELRYGDLCSAAKHLWRVVLEEASDGVALEEIAQRFFYYWKETDRPRKSSDAEIKAFHDAYAILAALDGIERFLYSRADRNPTFPSSARQKHEERRKRLARAVISGDIRSITTLSGVRNTSFVEEQGFQHMIELKRLSLVRTACTVLNDECLSTTNPIGDHRGLLPLTPPILKHHCSIATACKNNAILEWAGMIPDAMKTASGTVLLLHNAIARLQGGDRYSETIDPLYGLKGLFDSVHRDFTAQKASTCATQVLKLWIPHDISCGNTIDQMLLKQALRSFVNVAVKERMADYLGKRPEFSRALLDGAEPIPVPPGIDYPGILGWDKRGLKFIRVDFVNDALFGELEGITWEVFDLAENQTKKEWSRLRAAANGWRPLVEVIPGPKEICTNKNAPAFCASLFLGLKKAVLTDEQTIIPCAAPHVLVRGFNQEEMSFSDVAVLGYQLQRNSFETLAFIRRGWSLAQEGVSDQYADVWRIGITVTDITGFLEYCHADSSMRLTKRPFILDCGHTSSWAREVLFRTAFYRLRGKQVRPGILRIDPSTNLPMTVARAVNHLEGFPRQIDEQVVDIPQLKYVLSSSAESRAMALRMANDVVYDGPGGAAFFLMHFASLYFREDESLVDLLPKLPAVDPKSLPKRRAVLGYHELARRVGLLLQDQQPAAPMDGIEALTAGLWILALTENIRAQVLERLHLLAEEDLQTFKESLGLESFGIDSQSVLIAEEIVEQQSELVDRLTKLKRGATISLAGLDKTTPLGWWASLLVLYGFSEILFAKAAAPDGGRDSGRSKCMELTNALVLWDKESDDFPWERLESTCRQWTEAFAREAFALLAGLDRVPGLVLVPQKDSMFTYCPNNRKGTIDFGLPTGRFTLSSWRFLFSSIESRNRDIEFIRDHDDKSKKKCFWTETRVNGELVAISAMSTALAALAGITRETGPETCAVEAASPIDISSRETSSEKVDFTKAGTEVTHVPASLKLSVGTPSEAKDEPTTIGSAGSRTWRGPLSKMQHDSWKARQEDTRDIAGHVRIALLQMEVDASYEHPVAELCCQSSGTSGLDSEVGKLIGEVQKDMSKWNTSAADAMINQTRSCAEYRRRKILEEVLMACGSFKVDILVLPEYSVRPETAQWIARMLPKFAPETSVWAGTFRKPPYMIGDCAQIFADVPDWAAPLPIVFPSDPSTGPGDIKVVRWKKYPAAGLGEVFHPYGREIQPISWMLEGRHGFRDHRDLVCELICSEIFLLSSPSNLLSLGVRLRALSHKFGLPDMDLPSVMENVVLPDCASFSYFTSLQTPRGYRRHPIIIVPAFTTRPVDWAVTGQAGYLASGLTTVFCNAVHAKGKGQSCFIGTDCWDNNRRKPKPERHNPQLGPYHGVLPGIYNQASEDRGWLTGEEQALVIADIDPILSFGGDPSPESIGSSLTLVAHLPIIEPLQLDPEKKNNACRCSNHRNDLKKKFDELMISIADRLRAVSGLGGKTSIADHQPEILGELLGKLAELVGPKDNTLNWLKKRAEAYLNHHAGDPVRWPPPVALDWLWIDLDYNSGPMPIICIPEYRKAPGETEA